MINAKAWNEHEHVLFSKFCEVTVCSKFGLFRGIRWVRTFEDSKFGIFGFAVCSKTKWYVM